MKKCLVIIKIGDRKDFFIWLVPPELDGTWWALIMNYAQSMSILLDNILSYGMFIVSMNNYLYSLTLQDPANKLNNKK